MNASPELELAQLSLTGRRYSEAEEKFTRLLSTPEAPQAWLGLGLAKMGRLPSGKATSEEVVHCFNKALSLSPEIKDEAYRLALSVARAMLEEIESLLPKVAAAESAAAQARVSGLLHKGFSYMRATSNGSGHRPTLFTNLDALHDSYRGSVLFDVSTEIQSNAREMRSHLLRSVLAVSKTVTALVPEGHPAREESLTVAGTLAESLTLTAEQLRIKNLPEATPDLYLKPYRSSDEKTFFGICGGLAHRWGWKHSLVQLLFIVLAPVYIGVIWYLIEIVRTKQKLPTKGVPRPRKP